MITARVVHPGGFDSATSAQEAFARAHDSGSTAWIRAEDATPDEIAAIASLCELHPVAAEDIARARQRPKVEHYGRWLFVVVRPAEYHEGDDRLVTGELHVLVSDHAVIAVHQGGPNVLDEAEARIRNDAQGGTTTTALLHALLDVTVDGYGDVINSLDDDISALELAVFGQPGSERTTDLIGQLYFLQREVLEFHRAISPLDSALHELRRGIDGDGDWDVPFRDIHDHVHRQLDQHRVLHQLVNAAMNAHATQVSLRQNEDMRKISAWAAIAAVPTMIAGIYGMNFRHMPELDTTWGYPTVMSITTLICVTLYLRFRKSGWLG